MKILHILKSREYSGAENVVCTIIGGMPEHHSIYMSRKGSIEKQLQERGIEFYGADRLDIKSVKKAIKELEPDIIHAHDFTASVVAGFATKGIPVISHLHDNHPWMKKVNLKTVVYALSCSNYAKILTVSDSVGAGFRFKKVMSGRLEMIGNPFDMARVLAKVSGIPESLAYESDALFVGRFTEQKNPQMFVRIVKKLAEKRPDFKAVMLGRGELEEECRELAERLEISENIDFLGFVDNPYLYMRQAKCLIMPSRWEGFGLAALEAMALGTPVLACPVGGLPQIVGTDGGMLCETEEDFVGVYEAVSGFDKVAERARAFDNRDEYLMTVRGIYQECLKRERI